MPRFRRLFSARIPARLLGVPVPGVAQSAAVLWAVPLTALLTMPAYPPLEWPWAAWLALAPLILLLTTASGGVGLWFAAGWGYGIVHYAARFSWLPEALLVKGGLPIPAFLAIATGGLAVLACYPAAAIAISRWGHARWAVSPAWSFPLLYSLQDALLGVTPLGGTPWGSLAATQSAGRIGEWLLPLAGGSGLVLLIAAANGLWAVNLLRWASGRGWVAATALPAILIGLSLWPPAAAPPRPAAAAGEAIPFAALVVPGDLPVNRVADPSRSRESLRYFLGRTAAAATGEVATSPRGEDARSLPDANSGGDSAPHGEGSPARRPDVHPSEAHPPGAPLLVIWPEAAVSGRVERGKLLVDLYRAASALEFDLLLGSNARDKGRDYNSAYLLSGEQFHFDRYDKRRLVPLGEYVPGWLRWLWGKKLAAGDGDYYAGTAPAVLDWRGRKLGLAICFESILPGHARQAVRDGAQVLIVLSNDQWLTPAASRHHLQLTALRGLEVGREVVIAANGGWSGHLAGGSRYALRYGDAPAATVTVRPSTSMTPWSRWGYGTLAALYAAYLLAYTVLPGSLGRLARRRNR